MTEQAATTKPYDLTTYDGRKVDWITRQALEEAARILGYDDGIVTLAQGSYNRGGVAASGGTHDGGGVIDLAPYDAERKVRVLRSLGFAAWRRMPSQGPWGEHVHAVLIGNRELSQSAKNQVTAYLNGRNGLASNGPDDGPRQYVNARYKWRRYTAPARVSKGGTYNLFVNRDPYIVLTEVKALMVKHRLDWLAVQEATQYADVFDKAKGLTFWRGEIGECGIIVRDGLEVSNFRYAAFGDGWFTKLGRRRHALPFPRLTIDGWLRVGVVHMPTPTGWRGEVLVTPRNRLDDYLALAKRVKRFLSAPGRKTRVVLGDWNEPPTTQGKWAPAWIAVDTDSFLAFPAQKAGRGRIDGALINGGTGVTFKDLTIPESSDHEPVILTVTQG